MLELWRSIFVGGKEKTVHVSMPNYQTHCLCKYWRYLLIFSSDHWWAGRLCVAIISIMIIMLCC